MASKREAITDFNTWVNTWSQQRKRKQRKYEQGTWKFPSSINNRHERVSRPAYFKSYGPMMEIKMWRPWRQCISPKCLTSHLYPNGPSTECSRSVATVTYAYRVVGILRDDKQRRNRSHRKSNCKSFSLGKSRLELRTKSQSV